MKTFEVRVKNPHSRPDRQRAPREFASWCTGSLGVTPGSVRARLQSFLEEDHGGGCVTVWAGLGTDASREAVAAIVAKEDFVLCGLPLMLETFRLAAGDNGPNGDAVTLWSAFEDGARVRKGDVVLWAQGPAAVLLLGERVALNLGSLLSGVSTYTRRVRDALEVEGARQDKKPPALLETRKTTPGLRLYEKYATRTGGARNHRHGLDAGAMLKENHLRAVGDIRVALGRLRENLPVLTRSEIEVTTLAECEAALEEGADVVMLDNFSAADVRAAVALRAERGSRCAFEVSGNLDARPPEELVSFGVDFVSMGALIHKATWIDMSLQLYFQEQPESEGVK